MMRKALAVVALLAYLGFAALFLLQFRSYLQKPPEGEWNRAQAYLKGPGRYRGEPIRFTPSWLKNYATDFSRFKGFDFAWTDSAPVYWHFATEPVERPGYEVVTRLELTGMALHKLVREGYEVPPDPAGSRPRRPGPPLRPAGRRMKGPPAAPAR